MENQRHLRGAAAARKHHRKPRAADRLALWFSTGRDIDGLWVGSFESEPHPGLCRIEDALRLIKQHNSLHYSRVIHNLERVWVRVLPIDSAWYDGSLRACLINVRFVLLETTTLEEIASAIVHEATHARLERWGINYREKARSQIEAICLRRELSFVASLPHSEPLREQIVRTLEWCVSEHDHFSDVNFQQRVHEGLVETLRHFEAPDWFIRFFLRVLAVISVMRRLAQRFAGPSRQA